MWVEFILGDWIKYDVTNEHHKSIVDVMPMYQKQELKYTIVAAPKFQYQSLREIISEPYENSIVISSWSNLTKLLMSTNEHDKSIFLKFLTLEQIDNQNNSTRLIPEKLGKKIHGFKLKSGKTYRIEILQITKSNPDPKFDLEAITNADEILAIKKTDHVQGKYDVLDFIISTEHLERTRRSFFIIKPEKEPRTNYTVPRLHFSVDIAVSLKIKKLLGGFWALEFFFQVLVRIYKNLKMVLISVWLSQ